MGDYTKRNVFSPNGYGHIETDSMMIQAAVAFFGSADANVRFDEAVAANGSRRVFRSNDTIALSVPGVYVS